MFGELGPLIGEIINSFSETTVNLKRPGNSYSALARKNVEWNTKALFDPKGTVIRDGQYKRGLTLLVPSVPEYKPQEGDIVTYGTNTWTVVGVKPIGVDGSALGYELDVGQ